jgi:hypothetical protein
VIDTLFFMLQLTGIAILIGWAVVNDRKKDDEPLGGPLAYKQREKQGKEPPAGKTRRRGLARS